MSGQLRWPDVADHADGDFVCVAGEVGRVLLEATSDGRIWADFDLVTDPRAPRLRCVAFSAAYDTRPIPFEPGLCCGVAGRISLGRPSGPELHVTEWT